MLLKKLEPFFAMWAADRNFRCVLVSFSVSALGDQLTTVALPFMVMKLFGSPMVLGIVVSMMAIPRGLLILFGGALADRRSTSGILVMTQFVNMLLLGLLAGLVFYSVAKLWMIYGFALACGVSAAYSGPASSSIVMKTVQTEYTGAAIRIMAGIGQTLRVLGPSIAGIVLVLSSDGRAGGKSDAPSFALAFLLDALTFGISVLALKRIVARKNETGIGKHVSAIDAIVAGVRYVWRDARLRVSFLYGSAISFMVFGPLSVGIPVFAETFGQGAAAYSILLSASGAGAITGSIVSGLKPKIRFKNVGKTILLLDMMVGALLVVLGHVTSIWMAAAIMCINSALQGYLQIMVLNWTQQRVAPSMLGRSMSVFMFLSFVFFPISTAASGWILVHVKPGLFFAGCGTIFICIAVFGAFGTLMPTLTDRLRGPRLGSGSQV